MPYRAVVSGKTLEEGTLTPLLKKIKGVSAVQDMAKREAGRGAIAAGLALFYYLDGYNGTEWAALGSGVKSHLPLGYVFPIEAARYELGHYNKGKCPDDDDE